MEEERISKAEAARRFEISKTMISKYLSRGMPMTEDGKIPWLAAQQWRAESIVPELSGSWSHRHSKKVIEQAASTWARSQDTVSTHERPLAVTDETELAAPDDLSGEAYAERVKILHRLSAEAEVVRFARFAMATGLTAEQASAIGQAWSLWLCFLLDVHDPDLSENEPDWKEAFPEIDVAAASALFDQACSKVELPAVRQWTPEHAVSDPSTSEDTEDPPSPGKRTARAKRGSK